MGVHPTREEVEVKLWETADPSSRATFGVTWRVIVMIALAGTVRILKVQENIGHGLHAMIKRKKIISFQRTFNFCLYRRVPSNKNNKH